MTNVNQQEWTLPLPLQEEVKHTLDAWIGEGKIRRLWERDASLWTNSGEEKWLGWLTIVEEMKGSLDGLRRLSEEVKAEGFSHALLLGMGGSSLCPELLSLTFGRQPGFPEMLVLDSTDPVQVKSIEDRIDLARTLFIVASKSGTTLEPNIFKKYFFERVSQTVGAAQAGSRFIAITDPGSALEEEARADGFRHVFHGVPAIGGRYSALSNFGMVPGAVMGLDTARFLANTEPMVAVCSAASDQNLGVGLGAVLGVCARHGRDKVTFIASPGISDLGAWLEQLIAESTGKQGKAVIPVDREPLIDPRRYGADRLFVYLRLDTEAVPRQDAEVARLREVGHPVVTIHLSEKGTLGQEFFRWEIATAVAGSLLGINPFDQPDVEASKIETRKLTSEYERSGALPPDEPYAEADGLLLFWPGRRPEGAPMRYELAQKLRKHLDRLSSGDYFALLAYIPMSAENEALLQHVRELVLFQKQVATCLGFGPRFLHSTGQAYKGGPNTGVFFQITCDDAFDLPVPGRKYTFGIVKAAQARGDFAVLAERGRRVLRIHLPGDLRAGLKRLVEATEKAVTC